MAYMTGFLCAVPADKKDAYLRHAEAAWPIFQRHGALSTRECWGVDVPDGELTSFPMAVKKTEGEVVVFSYIEWPDKETADRFSAAMFVDPVRSEFEAIGEMPFDGKRMMWGGFEDLMHKTADAVPA